MDHGLTPRILLDIHCQRDRVLPGGAWSVIGATQLKRKLQRLFAWSRQEHIPIVSVNVGFTKLEPWPYLFPPHSLQHSSGAQRPRFAVLSNHLDFSSHQCTDLPVDLFERHQQVIFETTTMNPFDHARLDRLLSQLAVGRIYVAGAGLEWAVRDAVLGLICRNKPVTLIEDAAAGYDPGAEHFARRLVRAKGAMVCTVDDLAGPAELPARRRKSAAAGKGGRKLRLARRQLRPL